jgi:hypothetical protein
LDQNLHGVSRIGGSGVERISFRLRSHEVPSIEGSYEHVAHPLGGGRMVDRWTFLRTPCVTTLVGDNCAVGPEGKEIKFSEVGGWRGKRV